MEHANKYNKKYIHTQIHTHTYIHTYIYTHTYLHTYIYTYIHIYSFHWSSLCINCIWMWSMSINITQHKTNRKIHSQDKTIKQNKNTFTAVNQSITPGHQAHETIKCIRLILMTFEIFQSSSYTRNTHWYKSVYC
jgi:hypothetical protein